MSDYHIFRQVLFNYKTNNTFLNSTEAELGPVYKREDDPSTAHCLLRIELELEFFQDSFTAVFHSMSYSSIKLLLT